MKKQPKEMRGDSLLLKSSVLTGLVFIALIIMCNSGVIKIISLEPLMNMVNTSTIFML